MKKFCKTSILMVTLGMGFLISACSSSDKDNNGETGGADPVVTYTGTTAYSTGILFSNGTQIGNGSQNFHFTGNTTIKKGTYILKGWVYVDKGAELTIEPGTIIKGDKETKAALIVEPGGYVNAAGTKDKPIIMTSEQPAGQRKSGDWGGLIICGLAKNNNGTQQIEGGPTTIHGGDNDADNSGVFEYIRVEFAGFPFKPDQEINGVTFGSVGSGTTVDHIQVSYSNDDSYEWFGGAVNCKYLIAYKGWDDDFDTDNGFSGHVQFCLGVRDPRVADNSQSNGFESDNRADGAETSPFTTAVFCNVTSIGPQTAKNIAAGFTNDASYITGGSIFPNNGSKLGLFQAGMQIRRSSKLNIYNTLSIGWPIGVIIDGEKGATVDYAKAGNVFHLKNLIFADMGVIGSDNNKYYKDQLYDRTTGTYDASTVSYSHTFFLSEGNKTQKETDLNLSDPLNVGQNYAPTTTITGGSIDSNTFFTPVTYVGAFKNSSDTWMEGWTNFDPQNTVY